VNSGVFIFVLFPYEIGFLQLNDPEQLLGTMHRFDSIRLSCVLFVPIPPPSR